MLLPGVLLLLLSWITSSARADFNLTVLHTNDVHCRFEQINKYSSACTEDDAAANKCFGGYARLVQIIRDIRKEQPNAIFLSGGDFFQGTIWYTIYKWKVVSYFTNFLNLTASALGNHEFDDGVSGLVPYIKNAAFPVIAANIDTTKDPRIDGLVLPSITIEVEGRKIGIIGYVTQETKDISSPGKVTITDEIVGITKEAWKLKNKGVDILIAVGHAGYLKDLEIAQKVGIIDVVVGGHTNTFLWDGPEPSIEKSEGPYPTIVTQYSGRIVPVVQAYAFGKYMGKLEVTFDDDGEVVSAHGKPILLDHTVPEAQDILEELEPWKNNIASQSSKEVGRTRVFLDGRRTTCRMRECNVGNLITDAFVHQLLKFPKMEDQWGKVGIAIVNSGGIRNSIDERSRNGSITYGDLVSVMPFPNTVDLVKISGDALYQLFEFAVHDYDLRAVDPFGGFFQVSGLKVVYDISRPVNERVVELMARCNRCRVPIYSHVLRNETYDIATTSFIVGGGDGNKVIKNNLLQHQILGILDSDAVGEYMANIGKITIGTEHRIRFTHEMGGAPCSSRRVDVEEAPSGAVSIADSRSNITVMMVLLLSAWRLA